MNRRKFLQVSAAGLALSTVGNYAAEFADQKKRVGLIGCGWYGKVDLLTVVTHELGHVLGYEDSGTNGLMAEYLGTGMRRVPSLSEGKEKPAQAKGSGPNISSRGCGSTGCRGNAPDRQRDIGYG